jgi:hypothetical protein
MHYVLTFGLLTVVTIASTHHFGWEGIAVPAALWIIMPYKQP